MLTDEFMLFSQTRDELLPWMIANDKETGQVSTSDRSQPR
jgi:hypothetical protein